MNKHELVVFGEDWGGLPSSTQHLITQLLNPSDPKQARQIIWVNSIGLRKPKLNGHDLKRAFKKLIAGIKTVFSNDTHNREGREHSINKEPHIVNPITIPLLEGRLTRFIAKKLLAMQIKNAMNVCNMTSPVLWTSLPSAVDVVGELNECAVVYYCGDDFSGLAGVDHAIVAQREAELTEKSDLILTASRVLEKKFPALKTHCVEHGVDYALFNSPSARAHDLPNDGRPIAGFYGSINEWFDISMIKVAAERLPEWHFVFIGDIKIDVRDLKRLPNVQFFGTRAHHELPQYSQHWDVSLLPFIVNKQIQSCNPLKLVEYLATGTPVIATQFDASLKYQHVVKVIETTRGFVEALQTIHQTDIDARRDRQYSVAQQSWSHQAQKVHTLLEAL